MEDLHKAGGIPALVKYLLKHTNLIDGSQLTVTGKTLAENYADAPDIDFTDYKTVIEWADTSFKRIYAGEMPPLGAAPLGKDEVLQLARWNACGRPE